MSRIMFAAAASLLAAGVGTAQAADLPYGRAPYTVNQPLNINSWAGPYLGGNVGYAWGDVSSSGTSPSGFAGGIQGGYNWTSGPIVFGLEADIQTTGADDRFATWKFSNPWFGTARGRLGYSFGTVMVYGTGGMAFGELKGETVNLTQETHTNAGWTVGAGAEFMFAPKWSAKVEYLYVDLSSSNFSFTNQNNGYTFGLARVGVNYHF
jgi:outer membrane immunogenic protein